MTQNLTICPVLCEWPSKENDHSALHQFLCLSRMPKYNSTHKYCIIQRKDQISVSNDYRLEATLEVPLAMNIKSPDLTRGTAYIGQWLINKHVKKGEVLPIGTILT